LGIYVAVALLCGLYLLGMYRLPHDHDVPETLGVPRMLVALAFLTLGFYLLPGLFKTADGQQQRPRGEIYSWVNSFLLPDRVEPTAAAGVARSEGDAHLEWGGSLERALEEARDKRKLVFLNFTGML